MVSPMIALVYAACFALVLGLMLSEPAESKQG
jgi:organic hydroperoxide reductase OsmC/OhrA